ncbi:MAG: hypothetical protein CVV42_08005 [Candidatus Riflebacteria bacterium HGW-Riflebacteria-2]|jgi:hypothetical protein|nr:MAG: hypothetical protein CVV42_08005 [Candidatus Riflebacteria bacterium HGW-Riflebacteria-2]
MQAINQRCRSLDRAALYSYNQIAMIQPADKYCLLLVLTAAILIMGCSQTPNLPLQQTGSSSQALSTDPIQVNTVETSVKQTKPLKISPLEYAQKEYLDAYNDYVRLLRESGPQTIETLQALALYQKKYQIYQMLLKADTDSSK